MLGVLVARHLLLCDGDRHLALAVPLGRFSPEGRALDRFWCIAHAMGQKKGDGIVIPVQNHAVTFRTLRACAKPKPTAAIDLDHAQKRLSSARFSVNRRGELAIS